MYDNLYCKCFLDQENIDTVSDLCLWVNQILYGKLIPYPINSIHTTWGTIDVLRNKEYDVQKGANPDPLEGFLYWRYFLDIEPTESVTESVYIQNLRGFIRELKKQGIRVIPACAFEDELL